MAIRGAVGRGIDTQAGGVVHVSFIARPVGSLIHKCVVADRLHRTGYTEPPAKYGFISSIRQVSRRGTHQSRYLNVALRKLLPQFDDAVRGRTVRQSGKRRSREGEI